MNRRTLFGRFLAVAAAFVVAPAVKAEAAPAESTVPKTHAHFEGDGCPPALTFTSPDSGYFHPGLDSGWHRVENGVDMGPAGVNTGIYIKGDTDWPIRLSVHDSEAKVLLRADQYGIIEYPPHLAGRSLHADSGG